MLIYGLQLSKQRCVAATCLVLVAVAAVYVLSREFAGPTASSQVENVEANVPGPLDGMMFAGFIGTSSEQNRTQDTFIFSNGTFFSTECVKTCGYHAGSYFVRRLDGKIHFLSVSRCGYKDAKIEWRGTIANGVVRGESTWTVNRWYRTIEKRLVFEGRLVEQSVPAAGIRLDEK